MLPRLRQVFYKYYHHTVLLQVLLQRSLCSLLRTSAPSSTRALIGERQEEREPPKDGMENVRQRNS